MRARRWSRSSFMAPAEQTRSNILLFLTDDHAQWALGAYGNGDLRTPTLDYLAASGVQMENAFTPTPVCSPARASLLTGRLASQHGIHDYLGSGDPAMQNRDWLADEITLPQLLGEAGYETAMIGKWHVGRDEVPPSYFDAWFSLSNDYPFEHDGAFRFVDNGRMVTLRGYKTDIITDHAIRFLRNRADGSFFMVVGYMGTHSPWQGHPERLVSGYRRCRFKDIPQDVAYPFGRQNLESANETRFRPREALAQYYAAVTHIDEGVGRILDELEALGLRERTLVAYTSDHGLNCGHHGIWGKGNGTLPLNVVEESIRVPLIFNGPGLFAGQRRAEFVDHLDLFQTLLEFAGVSPPQRGADYYPGRSYLALLQNTAALRDWRDVQFGEYGPLRMIRTARFKLVRRYPSGPCELFDLQRDPRETTNLFDAPDYAGTVAALTALLERHFERYEDEEKSGRLGPLLPRYNTTEAWQTGE